AYGSRHRPPAGGGLTVAPRAPLAERPRDGGHAAQRPGGAGVVVARPGVPDLLRRLPALRPRLYGPPGVVSVVVRPRYTGGALDRRRAGRRGLDLHRALRLRRPALDAAHAGSLRLPALRVGTGGADRALRAVFSGPWAVQYAQRIRAHPRLVVAAAGAPAIARPAAHGRAGGDHRHLRLGLLPDGPARRHDVLPPR